MPCPERPGRRHWQPRSSGCAAVAVEAKICGLRRGADAAVAVRCGASYLGMILVPDARREVRASEARDIVSAADGRPVFGVFASDAADVILRYRDRCGLSGAQIHGALRSEVAARLRREGMRVWRVVRIADQEDAQTAGRGVVEVDATLVEPWVEGAMGGSGTPLDLALARVARTALAGRTMVLAGGLRPDSVAAAVTAVGPDVVDVSSGVERVPGDKDPALIRSFLEALVGDLPSP
ncbi:MAG: phosphoribosylanthranilate isomerase [Gemmatimonadales bacterium]